MFCLPKTAWPLRLVGPSQGESVAPPRGSIIRTSTGSQDARIAARGPPSHHEDESRRRSADRRGGAVRRMVGRDAGESVAVPPACPR